MCKAKAVSFAQACGHYWMHGEEPCASALARDPTGFTPCDELINELELQRVSGSWCFVINFKGQSIAVSQSSSGHCDEWQKEGYTRPNYSRDASQSSSAAVAVDVDGAAGEASNSDGSAMTNSDESGSRETEVETKTSEGKGKGLWKKIKGAAGKG